MDKIGLTKDWIDVLRYSRSKKKVLTMLAPFICYLSLIITIVPIGT